MNAFEHFKTRNARLFKDMGVDAKDVQFSKVRPVSSHNPKFDEILSGINPNKAFPASITDQTKIHAQKKAIKQQQGRYTQQFLMKKARIAVLVPLVLLASIYLFLTLLLP